MKILLVGGGTGDSISPLLTVAKEIKKTHSKADFLMLGSKTGPERAMAMHAQIEFMAITSGKLRRYFSWRNFLAPLLILAGFFESLTILKAYKPAVVFGTGSFVQVPVAWAAWWLKIPVLLHQQDVIPSLANKLCQLAATKITVTFEANQTSFSSNLGLFYHRKAPQKIIVTGNPFREELKNQSKAEGQKAFNLLPNFPTLLVLGGSTGAEYLNNLVLKALPQLSKFIQIIHITGKGKFKPNNSQNYHAYEFTQDMAKAYAAADIVLCRAGLSTLTELSNLK